MGRTARDNRSMPHPKPVEKVELSGEHSKRRFFLTILFLVIGAGALVYGFMQLLSKGDGWTEITASGAADVNCAEDFKFLYELGAGDKDSVTEGKTLSILYTDATVKAYEVFNTDLAFADYNNMYSINHSPNQVLEVEPELYQAFETMEKYGRREIYLGPIYQTYDDMFFCEDDSQILDYDPYQNPEVAAYYAKIAAFAADETAVNLELLGENQVRLQVSEEYQAFAEENGFTNYVDFFWMKNAFIVDCIADTLIAQGYTHGSISSYDGFIRNLDDRDVSYSFAIYSRNGNGIDQSGIVDYQGQTSIVYLRNYMMSDKDLLHYYELDSGEIRTSYIDIADGRCKTAKNDLVGYTHSTQTGCAQVLLQIMPSYITDQWNPEGLEALARQNIYSIYMEDNTLHWNEPGLHL